jgi:acylphosphatase
MTTIKARVKGKVQGVFFRAYIQKEAGKLGIVGWIKNEKDGSVSLEACGEREKLNQLIERINIGSPASKVEDLDIVWIKGSQRKLNDFQIKK